MHSMKKLRVLVLLVFSTLVALPLPSPAAAGDTLTRIKSTGESALRCQ